MLQRTLARIITATLLAAGLAVPAALPSWADYTPLARTASDMQSWNIMRQGDTDGDVSVPAVQKQVVLTGHYKIQPSVIATLAVDDVVAVRFDVTGGFTETTDGAWIWQTSQPPKDAGFPKRGISRQVKAIDNTAGKYTYFVAGDVIMLDGSGTLNIQPRLLINGVEQSGSISDFFVDYKPQISWAAFEKEYTVHAQDTEIIAQAPLCLDRTKFNGNGGGSLTRSLGLQRGGQAVTGNSDYEYMDYVYTSWTGRVSGYTFPTASDTFWMNIYTQKILPNDASSNVVASDVLTMTPSLDHSTIGDVLGGCTRISTADFAFNQTSFNTTAPNVHPGMQTYCEITDLADGSVLYSYRYENFIQSGCPGEGVKLGHTYRVVARQMMPGDIRPNYMGSQVLKLGAVIGVEDIEITITRNTFTEPILPGNTGPGAVVWQSKDNDTDSTPFVLGRGNSSMGQAGVGGVSTDGAEGLLVSSRPTWDTIRIERWGIDGRKQLAGQNYIDFTDPVPTGNPLHRYFGGGVSWFGNKDMWAHMGWGMRDAYITEGSFNSTSTTSYKIPQSSMDAVCRDFYGNDSFVVGNDNIVGLRPQSMATQTPTFRIYCNSPDPNITGNRQQFNTSLYVSVDTVTDGVANLKTLVNATPGSPLDAWNGSQTQVAVNEKPNLAPGDVASAYFTSRNAFGGTCSPGLEACAPTKTSLILIKADGSKVEIADTGFTGPAGRGMAAFSLAFDGNGKLYLAWTSTATESFVSQHYWELYSISDAGVITKVSDIALSKDEAFEGAHWTDPNAAGNDLSTLMIANGVGDDDKLYVRRANFRTVAYSVLNLNTNALWSGEAAELSVAGSTTFDNSGNMYLYAKTKDDAHYSVIRWGVGDDPTAVKGITSDDEVTVEFGETEVYTPTTNIATPTWSIDGGADADLFTIDPTTGKVVFKTAQPVGDYVLVLKVTNGTDTGTQTVTVKVRDTTAPDFTVTSPNEVEVGNNITVTPSGITESGTFSLDGPNAGLFEVNPTTGALTFKIPPVTTGSITVTLTITDETGNTRSRDVVFNIVPDQTAPVILTDDVTVAYEDLSVVDLEANESVDWEIIGGADSALFTLVDGVLTLVAVTEPGEYEVVVKATDGAGLTTTKTILVTVLDPDSIPPVITAPSPVTLDAGDLSVLTALANEEVTWEIDEGLDGELFAIDESTGELTFLQGQPAGEYRVTIRANDLSGNSSTKTIIVNVRPDGLAAPEATFTLTKWGNTRIDWERPTGAERFVAKRNGKVVCRTGKTQCVVAGHFKRSDKVVVLAFDSAGSSSPTARARFVRSTVATANLGLRLGHTVQFAEDSFFLTAREKAALRKMASKVKRSGFRTLTIIGHVDDQGSFAADYPLSLARARQVAGYLRLLLPKSVKIVVKAAGRIDPAKPNTSEANRSANRRAVVYGK